MMQENKREQERYREVYQEFLEESARMHERNKKWLRTGVKCLIFIPVFFLILLFYVTSNKMAFLVLWILSLILITIFLITVEYQDYKLQKKRLKMTGESSEISSLTGESLEYIRQKTEKIPKSTGIAVRIFKHDMKKVLGNVVAIVILIGLICLPCIYCWTNLLSSWSPYSDLNALNVGVCSRDEGFYIGDIYLNVGDMVVESLKENDSVGWVFYEDDNQVTYDVYDGKTYAAFVLPEDFTKKLVEFMDDDFSHPTIEYYENQKKNAIVPKITAKVKTTVQNQVNETIITSVSKIIAATGGYVTGGENNLTVSGAEALNSLEADLDSYRNLLTSFAAMTQSAQTIMDSSRELIPDLNSIVSTGENALQSLENMMVSGTETIQKAGLTMEGVFALVDSQLAQIREVAMVDTTTMEVVFSSVEQDVTLLQNQMKLLKAMLESWKELNHIEMEHPELDGKIAALEEDLENVGTLAGTAAEDGKDVRQQLLAKVEECIADFDEVKHVYQNSLEPTMQSTGNAIYLSLIKASGLLRNLDIDFVSVMESLENYSAQLQNGTLALKDSLEMAEELQGKVKEMSEYLTKLQQNEQYRELADMLEHEPEAFADFVAEPTQITQEIIYEISDEAGNSYASSMSAFYTVLALYLASLFCMVMIHAHFHRNHYPEIKGEISRTQSYLGRWMTYATISVATSIILALGDLLFIEVQCKHPVAFVCSVVLVGLVFNLFAYSCAFGLGLVGEALALLLMIISVACSSSFPFELLPDIFGFMNDWNLILFQPGMNMIKETIAGYNGVDYWIYFGQLMIYVVAALVIALGISRILPVRIICEWFEEHKNDSHVML